MYSATPTRPTPLPRGFTRNADGTLTYRNPEREHIVTPERERPTQYAPCAPLPNNRRTSEALPDFRAIARALVWELAGIQLERDHAQFDEALYPTLDDARAEIAAHLHDQYYERAQLALYAKLFLRRAEEPRHVYRIMVNHLLRHLNKASGTSPRACMKHNTNKNADTLANRGIRCKACNARFYEPMPFNMEDPEYSRPGKRSRARNVTIKHRNAHLRIVRNHFAASIPDGLTRSTYNTSDLYTYRNVVTYQLHIEPQRTRTLSKSDREFYRYAASVL